MSIRPRGLASWLAALSIATGSADCARGPTPTLPAPVFELLDSVGSGDIVGLVLDSSSHAPIPNALVILMPEPHDTSPGAQNPIVAGAHLDTTGRFALRGVAAGEYTLKVLMICYWQRLIPLRITPGHGVALVVALGRYAPDLRRQIGC